MTVTPLLNIDGLRLEATSGAVLVDGLSFALAAGECLALVGESGSGKSLATRAILGLLPPGVRKAGGRIALDGIDIDQLSPNGLRTLRGAGVGLVFQEPMTSLNPAMTIGRQLDEGLRQHRDLDPDARREACLAMLHRVRIPDPERCLASYPHEFSGGMRQRIMLASVMLLAPRLLIADEPTTALDTLSQREVMEVMTGLASEHGTAVILITHDLGLASQYAERMLVLERGRMVEQGRSRDILAAPQQDYTRNLVDSLPKRGALRVAPRGEDLLSIQNMSVHFRRRGSRETFAAVDGVSLKVAAGETVALVGGSGSGKTTLGRAALGLVAHSDGDVRFDGLDPYSSDRAERHAFRQVTQLVFQDPYSSLNPRMRVRDIVAEPLRHQRQLSAIARSQRLDATLDDVGLTEFAGRLPHQLSGGQRQRVAIARAVVTHPRFVVADEPVSALDATIQAQVLRLFAYLQARYGFACLFITHDLGVVEQIADRVIVMRSGRIVEQGSRDMVIDNPQHEFTRALLAATPKLAVSGQGESE